MSPSHTERIENQLITRGSLTAAEIARGLGVSQPTVSRSLSKLPKLLRMGGARSTRYALKRDLRGLGCSWPIYQVDAAGRPSSIGILHLLHQGETYFEANRENEYDYFAQGEPNPYLFPDLPWFLEDMRPQGYLGKLFAQAHSASLGIGTNPETWTIDETLLAILEFGNDTPGNLIVGEKVLQVFQKKKLESDFIDEADKSNHFDKLAEETATGTIPGSSAGGEQPKFTCCIRSEEDRYTQTIVKFSGPHTTEVGQRWADLLQAEALAGQILANQNQQAARTQLTTTETRTYLETERFDRVSRFGRRGAISLRTLVAATGGEIDQRWSKAAAELQRLGWLTQADLHSITLAEWFGHLIGNTDMHHGNLSLELTPQRPLALYPIYDMLPMRYAPSRSGDLPTSEINPPLPTPEQMDVWTSAALMAKTYWKTTAEDNRFSQGFRRIASSNLAFIQKLTSTL